jgi:hypothetical protein
LSGTPSFGASRTISTGNLMADCERWCRDNLPPRVPARVVVPRQERREGTALRVVPAPVVAAEQTPSRRGTFRPGPGWPGIPVARTGS